MATLAEIRQQYPQYDDMSDVDLADRLYQKFYSDMPRADFDVKLDLKTALPNSGPASEFAKAASAITQDPKQARIDALSKEYEALPGWQKPLVAASDIGSLVANGLVFGQLDEAAALARAPFTDKTFAQELSGMEQNTADAADRSGWAGTVAELAGGLRSALGLAGKGYSMGTNAAVRGEGLKRIAAGTAADGIILGGVTGAGSPGDLEQRAKSTALGMGIGAGAGVVTPYATKAITTVAQPLIAPIMARLRPEAYANRAVGEGMERAGLTADNVSASLRNAADDGQEIFNVADAMGNSGQRMLSTVARTPNSMRQTTAESLIRRQMDQGGRVAAALQDASGSPLTSDQYRTMLQQARATEARQNYGPVGVDRTAIDVSEAVDLANRSISPVADTVARASGAVPTDLARRSAIETAEASIRDPIRQAVKEARSYLASDRLTVTNVEKAFRAKTNMDQMIATATERGQGAAVAQLMPVRDALDNALARTSRTYASARDAYSAASGRIDAIDTGRQMAAPRARLEDNLNTFGSLPDEATQRSARIGYFDPLIGKAENAAGQMTNTVRPLMSNRMRAELPQMAAPGRADQLGRRLAREKTMFETANAALGGSKTADNLADAAEMAKFDPSVMMTLLRGRPVQAVVEAVTRVLNEAKGLPPSVVDQIAKTLLETSPDAAKKLLSAGAGKRAKDTALRALANSILGNYGTLQGGRLTRP